MEKHSESRRTALFLDRDGIVNVERGYVHKIDDFEFIDGIFSLCRAAVKRGMLLVIITNQAGIGRGFYTEEDFWKLTNWMMSHFEREKAPIAKVYHCPFHPEFGIGAYRQDSMDRKPNPGMLLRARKELGIDLTKSVLIGDKETDILAAKEACIGRKIMLAGKRTSQDADAVCQSLAEIQELLFPETNLTDM